MQDLDPSLSLTDIGDDLAFLHARTAGDPSVAQLAQPLAALLATADQTAAEHRQHRRALTLADAKVAGARQDLEVAVNAFAKTVLAQAKLDPATALLQAWFSQAPSAVVGQGHGLLEQWAAAVATRLTAETQAPLATHAQPLATAAHHLREAVTRRRATEEANRAHRLQVREPLLAQANGLRRETHRALSDLAVAGGWGKVWLDSFFRPQSKRKG